MISIRFFRLLCLIYLGASFVRPSLYAAVTVRIDPSIAQVDEPVMLSIEAQGDFSDQPRLPAIGGLKYYQGGQSSSMSWINGKSSRSVTINYQVVAEKPGRFTIPSFTVQIDGKNFQTDPVSFVVEKAGSQLGGSQQEEHPQLFIERELSKKEPFRGEVFFSTVKIYSRVDMQELSDSSEASDSFKTYNVGQSSEIESLRGVNYRVITLKFAHVALRSGKLELPAFKLKAAVLSEQKNNRRSRSRDLFSEFFENAGRRYVNKVLSSGSEQVQIHALPAGKAPDSFIGAIGQFSLASDLTEKKLKVGETTTLTLTVTGAGLLDTIDKFEPDFPSHLKIYSDKPETTQKEDPNKGILSKKVYKFAIVPTKAGDLDLGPIEFSFFNPLSQRFETTSVRIPLIQVEANENERQVVVGGQGLGTGSVSGTVKSEISQLGSDLLDIRRDSQMFAAEHAKIPWVAWLLLACSAIAFGGGFVWRQWLSPSTDRKAQRKARALRSYKTSIEQLNFESEDSLEKLFEAWKSYLGDKLNLHSQALTIKDIGHHLKEIGVSAEDTGLVNEVAKKVDEKIYSGRAFPEQQVHAFKEQLSSLVEEIEKKC